MDTVSPDVRSRMMASVRSRNTEPEMNVRKVAHALGYRFRIHVPDLPGRPILSFHDIAWLCLSTVVFGTDIRDVNGPRPRPPIRNSGPTSSHITAKGTKKPKACWRPTDGTSLCSGSASFEVPPQLRRPSRDTSLNDLRSSLMTMLELPPSMHVEISTGLVPVA